MGKWLAPGLKSSEFLGLAGFFAYLFVTGLGILSPKQAATLQSGVAAGKDSLGMLFDLIGNIISQFGDTTLLGGLVWSYLKQRTKLKDEDLKAKKLELIALVERYRAAGRTGVQK